MFFSVSVCPNSSQLEFANDSNTMRETFTIPLFSKYRFHGTFSNYIVFSWLFFPAAPFLRASPPKISQPPDLPPTAPRHPRSVGIIRAAS